jgi:dephospho-CoA kinase
MKARGRKIVCLEIPLLFETGAEDRVDYVITVSAPANIQRRRVMRRANMSEEKFKSILSSQWPDAQKRAASDFVVDTGLGYARTYRQLAALLKAVTS